MRRLKDISPAVIIISAMVLINAGVILYFADRFDQSDKNQRASISQVKKLSESNRRLLQQQTVERQIRTDQSCKLFEREHLRNVQSLEGTYSYLRQARDTGETDTLLYKLVLKNTPRTISEGETDTAPEYCDAPNTGLPEPDPKIPPRPKFLPPSIVKQANALEKTTTGEDKLFGSRQDLRKK